MIHHRGAHLQRHPQRHRVAEAMKERQDAERAVLVIEVDRLDHRLRIGRDVAVRQHHAFRLTGAAAGEDDGRQVVQAVLRQPQQPALENPARQQDHLEVSDHLLPRVDPLADRLQVQHLDPLQRRQRARSDES